MAITMQQALTAQVFHEAHGPYSRPCDSKQGPLRWRRNGKTKTWKTRPTEFRIPVKFGLRSYDYISEREAEWFHVEEDCQEAK
jgi:hypothetical protein